MSQSNIEVHPREETGKNANRRLRAQDQVPAVVYGGDRGPVPIQVGRRTIHDLLRTGAGENTVFLLKMAGTDKSRHTIIRELQTDPITGAMIHIDFQRILMTESLRVTVPIELQGTPTGVRVEAGILDFVNRELEVSCLPDNIPAHLELDVSALHVGQHLEARHIALPDGVTLEDDETRVIVAIAHGKVSEEEEESEEELLEAQAPEPELIGRHKEEDAS